MNINSRKFIKRLFTRTSLAIILLLTAFSFSKGLYAQDKSYHIKTVVIDAGHGGKDPGALGKSSREKDIVLNISLKLGGYIKKYFPNVNVVYTRKTDVFIPLNKRSEIANKHKADLFISIHANANNNSRIRGTETYTLGLHKTKENLAVAMKENAVMQYEDDWSTKYEGFDPNNPASYIIFNLMQGVNRDKSISMAELTEHQFKHRVGRHSRGVREAGFWVLKQVSMPSILVEVGFISNPTEEKFLKTKKGQDYLASAIFRAFRVYKDQVEQTSVVLHKQQENEKKIENEINPLENTAEQVEFCIQLKSSIKQIPLNSRVFKNLKNITERKINGTYKYTIGSTSNYSEILNLQKTVRKKIKDCFVVAFYKGKRISLSKAKELQKT
ncbi:N-acetylmuramoyl-L-alanine amidase [Marinifilum breve]|uniref:N-acetylmuramoyl-L-alanine amidase n=1 Tax=Marinifilum breve TaxID=2184082 RepID=A0A2V4A4Q1_9BACT|nr:N-acetylmuramoyl-L-alanine amidase [Marinifilum breve]PXY02867.1 N-acetylmuramoyl-L-alanine amidase [Marinifilum breve]